MFVRLHIDASDDDIFHGAEPKVSSLIEHFKEILDRDFNVDVLEIRNDEVVIMPDGSKRTTKISAIVTNQHGYIPHSVSTEMHNALKKNVHADSMKTVGDMFYGYEDKGLL